jgi:glycosyltransferase involved in cell wall biosynthesis
MKNLSVIIPFLGSDLYWKDLLQDLKPLPAEAEILLVGPEAPDEKILKRATESLIAEVRYVPAPRGRGVQLNTGAKAAKHDFFWFLHADSKVPRPTLFRLETELQQQPAALHFFHLHFLNDGPKLMGLNSLAANLRSRYLQMPFGDQGFAISRAQFYRIGGFPEDAPYGEDHIFVWEARRKRVPLNMIPAAVFTSARRYDTEGWAPLTRKRVLLTIRQATNEALKLFKVRASEKIPRLVSPHKS